MAAEIIVHCEVMGDELVSTFLETVAEFQQMAWTLHQEAEHAAVPLHIGREFSDTCYRLQHVVNEILIKDTPADNFTAGCFKIAGDLQLKLQNLIGCSSAVAIVNVNPVSFCASWGVDDVEALGHRLREMIQLWSSKHPEMAKVISMVPPALLSVKHLQYFEEKEGQAEVCDESTKSNVKGSETHGLEGLDLHRPAFPGQDMLAKPKTRSNVRLAPAGIVNDFILDSLAYSSMFNREDEIASAHRKTFEWVFDPSEALREAGSGLKHELNTWLSSNELGPVYWITGKPGSGKSTFVRYLYKHEQLADHLNKWSDGKGVTTAGFFFWTIGSREQRSQTGLLRSLLHQLLSAHPEHMPSTFPDLWQELRTMTTKERIKVNIEWTVPKLIAGFETFMDVAIAPEKICLFVDGLDEFDGDHHMIIDFFKRLAQRDGGRSIKMCLSSRPWSVFEAAFDTAVPNLKLQDLTRGDMLRYATDRLNGNPHFQHQLSFQNPRAAEFVDRVVEKADGVFLWVRLALNRILDAISPTAVVKGFQISQVDDMLKTLPSDIEALFDKLLFQDQNYLEIGQAASIFQLLRARGVVADLLKDESSHSPTIWEMAFALDLSDDDLVLKDKVKQPADALVKGRCQQVSDMVAQRFAGLLDIFPPTARHDSFISKQLHNLPHYRITYIHRTVRDWLMERREVQERLVSEIPGEFDAHLRLLRSYVLRLKMPLDEPEHHRRLDEWWPDIALAMTHARYVRKDPRQLKAAFLNELNATLSWYWQQKSGDPYDHWARSAFGSYEARMKAPPIWQPFLCLATKFGLKEYVIGEIKEQNRRLKHGQVLEQELELMRDDATPLLSYATEFLCSTQKTIFPLSDPSFVAGLLRSRGHTNLGPNHEYVDFNTRSKTTAWIALLRHLRDARRRKWIDYYDINSEGTERWAKIVRLFLEEGEADVNAIILADAWDPQISAVGVLEHLEETYGSVEILRLKQLFQETKQAQDH
ncbi:small s protein [Paramyrothecium foliicola]|nr:small s protein [Paramyrothecium foliicola]